MVDQKLSKKLFILPSLGVGLLLSGLFTHIFGNYELKSNILKV
jgi:hypothetical protein